MIVPESSAAHERSHPQYLKLNVLSVLGIRTAERDWAVLWPWRTVIEGLAPRPHLPMFRLTLSGHGPQPTVFL